MYKKIIFLIFSFVLVFTGCSMPAQEGNQQQESVDTYVRSVFIAYYELSEFTMGKSEGQFKKEINKALKALSSKGFNRVTVQVRAFADAFYKSSYFPTSSYFSGKQGDELTYDPLSIMIDYSHKYKMTLEAWLNPYRVSFDTDFKKLASSNPAKQWKDTSKVYVCDDGIYFNPADEEVTNLIVNGVREIAENYAVDSICFDDYFYPTKNDDIDETYYNEYVDGGGSLSFQEWRRDNVSKMVESVYSTIKEINKNITFGISPASNISNDYSSLYADVVKWSQNDGYVDYICPQIYFGFQNESQPFMKTVKLWYNTASCKLYIALPLYKAGKEDKFAGELGKNEFVDNSDIISRQVTYLGKIDKIDGFYIFSYSSLKDNDETANLYSAMQNSSE